MVLYKSVFYYYFFNPPAQSQQAENIVVKAKWPQRWLFRGESAVEGHRIPLLQCNWQPLAVINIIVVIIIIIFCEHFLAGDNACHIVSSGSDELLLANVPWWIVGLKRARVSDDDSDIEYDDQVTMAQMQEVYGEYATSLTERVKRRRNQHVTYNDSDDNNSNFSDSHHRSELRRRLPVDDTSSEASNASMPEGLHIFTANILLFFFCQLKKMMLQCFVAADCVTRRAHIL